MTANEKCLSLKQQLQTQDGFSVFKKHYENLEVTQKKILNSFEKNAFYISNIYDKQELFEHRINDFFSNMKMSLINSSKHRYHENKQDSDVIININEE